MKKWLLVIFLFPVMCAAQNLTTLTGTVTDSAGQTWNNATWCAIPSPTPGITPKYTDGTLVTYPMCGTLSPTGAFSGNIGNTSNIVPYNTGWIITIQSDTSAPSQTLPVVYPTGASFNMGTFVSANITPPVVQPSPWAYAYSSTEIANPSQGALSWFALPSANEYVYNAGAWQSVGGASGGCTTANCVITNPSATQTITQPNNTSFNIVSNAANTADETPFSITQSTNSSYEFEMTGDGWYLGEGPVSYSGNSNEAQIYVGDAGGCANFAVCISGGNVTGNLAFQLGMFYGSATHDTGIYSGTQGTLQLTLVSGTPPQIGQTIADIPDVPSNSLVTNVSGSTITINNTLTGTFTSVSGYAYWNVEISSLTDSFIAVNAGRLFDICDYRIPGCTPTNPVQSAAFYNVNVSSSTTVPLPEANFFQSATLNEIQKIGFIRTDSNSSDTVTITAPADDSISGYPSGYILTPGSLVEFYSNNLNTWFVSTVNNPVSTSLLPSCSGAGQALQWNGTTFACVTIGSNTTDYFSFTGCTISNSGNLNSCAGTVTFTSGGNTTPTFPAMPSTDYAVQCTVNTGSATTASFNVTGALTTSSFPYAWTEIMENGVSSNTPTIYCSITPL